MHLDSVLLAFVAVILMLAVPAVVARIVRQPYAVGYIVAGVIMGPSVLGFVTDAEFLTRLGAIGVLLLLFFVGMEVSPRKLGANWKVAVFGTLLQISVTTGLIVGLGSVLEWPLAKSVLVGFIVSLSSTAVVLKLLEDWKELDTRAGQDVLSVLLVQDLAIIPMLIGVGLLGGEGWDQNTLIMQGVGAVILIGLAVWVSTRATFSLPMGRLIRGDRELQVLAALVICFGLALISGLLELSSALGAFVGGMVIHAARETRWVDQSLHGFRVIFIAFFFISVGMLIDVNYLLEQWWMVALVVTVAVFANTFINAGILRLFGRSWPEALYAGALLSQIGEFSFVLATVGWTVGLLTEIVYQGAVSVIAISLVLSPAWIGVVKWHLRRPYGWHTAQLHEPAPRPTVEEALEQPVEAVSEEPVPSAGSIEADETTRQPAGPLGEMSEPEAHAAPETPEILVPTVEPDTGIRPEPPPAPERKSLLRSSREPKNGGAG